jgi:hypothetical protein
MKKTQIKIAKAIVVIKKFLIKITSKLIGINF